MPLIVNKRINFVVVDVACLFLNAAYNKAIIKCVLFSHNKNLFSVAATLAKFATIDEEESVFVDQGKRPEQHAMDRESVDRLISHLDQLKPKYREVLEYKYLLGYSNNEIAEILGISASVVSTRAQRALDQLKERFEQEEG